MSKFKFTVVEGSFRRGQSRFFVNRYRIGEKVPVESVFAGNTRDEAEARRQREIAYWNAQCAIAQI
jgi:hypothetical protein